MSEASLTDGRDSTTDAPGVVPSVTCPSGCPRHATLTPLLAGVGWLAAAVAALSVAAVPYDFGESLCGAWGCFPPVPALAAMHLFWGVAFGAAVWAVRGWRPALLRPTGLVLVLAALAGAAVVIGRDLPGWYEWVPAADRHHWPRRVGYSLATLTDAPLVQALVAGVACIGLGRRPGVRPGSSGPKSVSDEFRDPRPRAAGSTQGDER